MKKIYLLALLGIFISAGYAQGIWNQSKGPNAGTAKCYFIDGSSIWIGTPISGAFVSNDNGKTWQPRNKGMGITNAAALNVTSFARKGTFLFVSTFGDGIYRSSDNGLNWSRFVSGLTGSSLSVQKIIAIGANMIAITNGGVFVSTNDGVSWSNTGATLPSAECVSELAFGGKYYIGFYYNSTGMLYSTEDDGLTWNPVKVPTANANWWTTSLAAKGNRLYISLNGKDVFYTEDQGENYTALPAISSSVTYYGQILFKGDTLFVMNPNDGVFRFNQTSNTWAPSSIGLPDVYHRGFLPAGDGSLLLLTINAGIYKSNKNGNLWTKSDAGFAVSNVTTLEKHNNEVYAGTMIYYNTLTLNNSTGGYGGDGLYASSNNGGDWEVRNIGIPIISNSISQVRLLKSFNNKLAAAAEYSGIYISSDNGQTWLQSTGISGPNVAGFNQSFAYADNKLFYASLNNPGSASLMRSADDGQTFQLVSNLPLSGKGHSVLNAGGNNLVYIVLDNGAYKILQSSDAGNTWTEKGTFSTFPNATTFHNGSLYVYLYTGYIMKSSDGGNTWSQSAYINPVINALAGVTANGQNYLIAGTNLNGIMYSTDDGSTWQEPASDLPAGVASSIKTLLVSNDTLLAGTDGRGVWRIALKELFGLITSAPSKPINQSLKAPIMVMPNPAKDFCRITLQIEQLGNYQISVFDINGRQVLPTEKLNLMPGESNLVLSTSHLSPGLYFIKAETPSGFHSARFIVQ